MLIERVIFTFHSSPKGEEVGLPLPLRKCGERCYHATESAEVVSVLFLLSVLHLPYSSPNPHPINPINAKILVMSKTRIKPTVKKVLL